MTFEISRTFVGTTLAAKRCRITLGAWKLTLPGTRCLSTLRLFLVMLGVAGPQLLRAESIPVPNASFESPATTFVDTRIDAWQKSPKPDWYQETGGFFWDQLAGVFLNAVATNSAHIDNMDGAQGLYLFAVPEVAVFQDYNSTEGTNAAPSHAFAARFETGQSYELTVGIIGGGGGMADGTSLELSAYYRDATSNRVTVAATNITFTPAGFPTTTHFLDATLKVPAVRSGDRWAGQYMGIQFASTVRPELANGGYWDLDNVRLSAATVPIVTLSPGWVDGKFQLTLRSDPGLKFDVLATSTVAAPVVQWNLLGQLTNTTGTVSFADPATNIVSRFYQVRSLP